jgi:hypothetical protein
MQTDIFTHQLSFQRNACANRVSPIALAMAQASAEA